MARRHRVRIGLGGQHMIPPGPANVQIVSRVAFWHEAQSAKQPGRSQILRQMIGLNPVQRQITKRVVKRTGQRFIGVALALLVGIHAKSEVTRPEGPSSNDVKVAEANTRGLAGDKPKQTDLLVGVRALQTPFPIRYSRDFQGPVRLPRF